jgi:hypothetical protein
MQVIFNLNDFFSKTFKMFFVWKSKIQNKIIIQQQDAEPDKVLP